MTWREASCAAYEAGAAALTVHGRTRAQGYEGKADKSLIASCVRLLEGKIPVFASGDIFSPEDARAAFEQTGCAAVMFARGAMGNPFIFGQTRDFLQTGSYEPVPLQERLKAAFSELELLCTDKGEDVACREMRKRFAAYTKGIAGGAKLREQLVQASSIQDYETILEDYFASGAAAY